MVHLIIEDIAVTAVSQQGETFNQRCRWYSYSDINFIELLDISNIVSAEKSL